MTTDATTRRYIDQRTSLEDRLTGIRAEAEQEGRQLTADELTMVREASDQIEDIDGAIETLTRATELGRGARLRIDQTIAGGEDAIPKYRDAGEVLYDMLHYREEKDARTRFDTLMYRAEHMGTEAALTTPTAGDVAALDVTPKVGPVININPRRTPFLAALAPAPMTSYSFDRPYITDPDFDTGVDEQALQKAELASEKFDADVDNLKGKTWGGYLNVSLQVTTFTPGQLAVIIDQLRRRRDQKLEGAAITEAQASTGNVQLETSATAAEFLAAIWKGARKVWQATEEPAEWVLMGPLGWERFGTLLDAADRPLFPTIGAANAPGAMAGGAATSGDFSGNPVGLRPVVSGRITTDELWIGNSLGIEAYRYDYPLLQSLEASVLGQQVAVASSLVVHRPTPTANSIQHLRPGAET